MPIGRATYSDAALGTEVAIGKSRIEGRLRACRSAQTPWFSLGPTAHCLSCTRVPDGLERNRFTNCCYGWLSRSASLLSPSAAECIRVGWLTYSGLLD